MNHIKKVHDKNDIKQLWLPVHLGKSCNIVNGYVQNRNQPSLEVLFQIAKMLQVEVSELLVSKKD